MKGNRFLLLIGAVLFAGLLCVALRDSHLHGDEALHFDVIADIVNHEAHHAMDIPMLPTYHYLIGMPGWIYRPAGSLPYVRFISFCFSVLSVLVFYKLARFFNPTLAGVRTAQYAFFPLIFPMFFLVYTDAVSLTVVLLAIYFTSRSRYNLAGASIMAAVLLRQNNILWLLLCCVFVFNQEKSLAKAVKKAWTFPVVFLAFAALVVVNRGLAFGVHDSFPLGLYSGNVFFMLLLFFLFFLPLQLEKATEVVQLLKRQKVLWLLIPLLYFLYIFTFSANHPYNRPVYSFFLRNKLLLLMTSSFLCKSLLFIPMIYSALSLITTKLVDRRFYWIYPAAVLFVLPSWLIEQRYYLIPFSLFILARSKSTSRAEYLSVVFNATIAVLLFYGIFTNRFFL